jgi:hypothetical protein
MEGLYVPTMCPFCREEMNVVDKDGDVGAYLTHDKSTCILSRGVFPHLDIIERWETKAEQTMKRYDHWETLPEGQGKINAFKQFENARLEANRNTSEELREAKRQAKAEEGQP